MNNENIQPLKKVGIVGVPFEKGQKKYGVSVGPAALRSAGLIKELLEIENLEVQDYGDIETTSDHNTKIPEGLNMLNLPMISECNKNLSAKVSQIVKDGRVVVTIGGDHSIGLGTVNGHRKVNKDLILIWIDAHADINTNQTSGSGSVHGMPVALLAKELSNYWPQLPTMDWHVPDFSLTKLGYIGLRSVDEYERLILQKYNVPAYAMEDIDEIGVKKAVKNILNKLDPKQEKPIHVSFDIDSLDPLEAPSTGTPVRGGLTLREGVCIMEQLYETGRIRGIDLVEVNPAIGSDADRRNTIEAGIAILKAGLGYTRRGTAPKGVKDIPK